MTDSLLPVGSLIGKYEVLQHIASGGMAEVYKARDTQRGRLVALKVLDNHLTDNPVILERFRREARHAARLSHKNIVAIHEWGQHEAIHFLAMEYVEGIDLHDYIGQKGTLDPHEAWMITVQAVRALDHAAKQGITHRDIKPSNLLLSFRPDNKPVVKLADLGLAREVRAGEFRVTRDGTTVGTVDYMAPEQARDSALADCRSDIYSLGCTLYHMLAGQPPFPDGGLGERIFRHLQTEVPDIRLFNRRVPDPLWTVLRKMLEKDPADRYQTPAELLLALLQLKEGAAPGGPRRRGRSSARGRGREGSSPAEPVDPRVAAAGQFERAKVVMSTDNQELAYAYELLVSCCHLDPANTMYRKVRRQVARAMLQEKRWGRWLAPVGALAAKAKLQVARASGEHAKVLEYGEEVLALSPEDASTHLVMVDAARALDMKGLAIWLLEELCKQDPEDAELLRLLGRAYEKDGETDKAILIYRGILRLVPYDLEANRKLDKLSVEGTLRRGHLGR